MTAAAPEKDPRFYDFDAAFAELDEAGIPFRLLGQVWQLPVDVPADVILRIQRLMGMVAEMEAAVAKAQASGEPVEFDMDQVVAEDLSYERIVRQMVGDELVDKWVERGIGYRMLQAVSQRLFAIYTGQDPDAEGEAPAANRAARRAAKKSTAKKGATRKSAARRS